MSRIPHTLPLRGHGNGIGGTEVSEEQGKSRVNAPPKYRYRKDMFHRYREEKGRKGAKEQGTHQSSKPFQGSSIFSAHIVEWTWNRMVSG